MIVADITEDLSIYPVLAELVACLTLSLGDGAPCFSGLLMGDLIPTEYVGHCEDEDGKPSCGAAYVRVVTAYPTENFPDPLVRPTCNSVMAYQVRVGVVRCASVGLDNGDPVEPEELERITLQQLSDMKSIRQAIQCCLINAFPNVDHVLGAFEPMPQEGDVVGGEWPVTLLEDF